MATTKSDNDAREQRILDAAVVMIMRQGYDKTTMADVATEVGISRGIVYLHFESKDALLEALIRREVMQYTHTWLEHIEANPRGGTIGGIYRAVASAINSRPFMAAMMRRDRRILGNYLQKPGNMFGTLQSSTLGAGFLQALQAAGAVRNDIDPAVMSHILDILSYGLVTIQDFRRPDESPPFDMVMEAMAHMLDRVLTPEDGGNSEAGKAVIRQIAAAAQQQFRQIKNTSET